MIERERWLLRFSLAVLGLSILFLIFRMFILSISLIILAEGMYLVAFSEVGFGIAEATLVLFFQIIEFVAIVGIYLNFNLGSLDEKIGMWIGGVGILLGGIGVIKLVREVA